jgi:hypothetical protein
MVVNGASPPSISLPMPNAETSISVPVTADATSSPTARSAEPSQKYQTNTAPPAIAEVRSSHSRSRSRPSQRTGCTSVAQAPRSTPAAMTIVWTSTDGTQPCGRPARAAVAM